MNKVLLGILGFVFWPSIFIRPAIGSEILRSSGQLESQDNQLDDGSYYDLYRFSGLTGDQVTIDMVSSSFDTYILLLDPSGETVSYNDDVTEGNTNSQISLNLPTSGEYTVIANSYSTGARGGYLITINYRDVYAFEYTTYCGLTSQTMQMCSVKKGRAVLNGREYISHTYNHPDGEQYRWLSPHPTSTANLCGVNMTVNTLLKINDGEWLEVTSYCQNDAFYVQLPSGGIALIVAM
jgi:hypothetical protein